MGPVASVVLAVSVVLVVSVVLAISGGCGCSIFK